MKKAYLNKLSLLHKINILFSKKNRKDGGKGRGGGKGKGGKGVDLDPDIEDSCEEECAIPNVRKQLLISPQFEKLKKIKYNFLFQHLKGQSKLNATSWDQVTYGAH